MQVLARNTAGECGTWIDHDCLDKIVTYMWSETNPNDGDGIIEWTGVASDGSPSQVITLAEESGVYHSGQPTLANGIVTIPTTNDNGETAGTPIALDLTSLISSPHPDFIDAAAGDTVALAYDAGANTVTVAGSVITQVTVNGVTTTTSTAPDGTAISWDFQADDDVSAVALVRDPVIGKHLIRVTESGVDVDSDPFCMPESNVIKFVAGADACTPANLTGCAVDMYAQTINTWGDIYESVAGSASWAMVHQGHRNYTWHQEFVVGQFNFSAHANLPNQLIQQWAAQLFIPNRTCADVVMEFDCSSHAPLEVYSDNTANGIHVYADLDGINVRHIQTFRGAAYAQTSSGIDDWDGDMVTVTIPPGGRVMRFTVNSFVVDAGANPSGIFTMFPKLRFSATNGVLV